MNEASAAVDAEGWVIERYGKVEDLELRSTSLPTPTGSQMLVRVEAASLNPLDLKLISGVMDKVMPVSFPFLPGSDVCGRVAAVGPDVAGFAVGDRIAAMTLAYGAMATHVLCDARGAVARVPDGIGATDLASLPEAGMTALAVLREAALEPGKTIAVIGATGGIGLLLCHMAKRAGARVIATATPDDEALVRANGASDTVDYASGEAIEAVREMVGDGVDVLVDLIHQFEGLPPSARAVRRGGRLVSTLMGPDAGAFGGGVEVRYVRLSPTSEDLRQLVDDVAGGLLSPTVTAKFPFADVPRAYIALRDGHVRGKLAVECG